MSAVSAASVRPNVATSIAIVGVLFFLIGLNLLGVYEFTLGSGIGNAKAAESLTRKSDWRGSFATGVLAVIVASRPMAATERWKSSPASQIAVSTPPGAIALMRMPFPAFSAAAMRAMSSSAARAWMISGRPVSCAASICTRNDRCCASALSGV